MTDCSKRASFLAESMAIGARTREIAPIVTYCATVTEDLRRGEFIPGNKSGDTAVRTAGGYMSDLFKGDGVDRRGFLRCMAWAGTGVVWTVAGGVPSSKLLGQTNGSEGFQFVQISDSHIGFNKPANTDVNATLQVAIDRINALPQAPEFLIHTGDLTHTAKASEFDTLGQLLQGAREAGALRSGRARQC